MHAYKFRLTSYENDEFIREISVLANQTFEDFHKCIVKTCKFPGKELASFYLCDNQWHKRQEITLMDMSDETLDESDFDDDESENKKPILVMKDVKLNKVINDPHQKLIYIYDFFNLFTIDIELIKIIKVDSTENYPMVELAESDIIIRNVVPSSIIEGEEYVFLEEELSDDIDIENDDIDEKDTFFEDDQDSF
ncbi:MAG: plasmid pRiA4b ORF-3 family protein [Bacteroidales bacterium]|nr:plasmid pRiA4b ORF-3 family protein [Bacteroidales bacterium]